MCSVIWRCSTIESGGPISSVDIFFWLFTPDDTLTPVYECVFAPREAHVQFVSVYYSNDVKCYVEKMYIFNVNPHMLLYNTRSIAAYYFDGFNMQPTYYKRFLNAIYLT